MLRYLVKTMLHTGVVSGGLSGMILGYLSLMLVRLYGTPIPASSWLAPGYYSRLAVTAYTNALLQYVSDGLASKGQKDVHLHSPLEHLLSE
jgi:hypothetical protein